CKTPYDYISKLILIYYGGYPIPKDFIENLKHFIDKNIPNNSLDPDLLHSGIESKLPEMLKYIIKDKDLDSKIRKQFKSILKQFEENMRKI
ncbi:hypothetical protein B6D15_05905, partial [Gilliamella apicola]